MEPTKRELRQQKREIKRLGNQHRRRLVKRALAEDPENAPDVEPDFGRFSSARFNGMDRDQTRRRSSPDAPAGSEGPEGTDIGPTDEESRYQLRPKR